MFWLWILFALALVLLYLLIVRPIPKQQPMFVGRIQGRGFAVGPSAGKADRFRTKLAARLLAIAGILVGSYDKLLPLVSGQDWTPLTAKLPAWSLPVGMVLIAWLFNWLREITDNPPHIIVQKDDKGVPAVVAIEKPAG
jgi:hypothetical protein